MPLRAKNGLEKLYRINSVLQVHGFVLAVHAVVGLALVMVPVIVLQKPRFQVGFVETPFALQLVGAVLVLLVEVQVLASVRRVFTLIAQVGFLSG